MSEELGNTGAEFLTLMDEEGVEHEFEMIDNLEVDGVEYVALVPFFEDPEDALQDSGELIILKVLEEENGEEVLEALDDDVEFDKIGAIFKDRLKDTFDFEE